MWSLRLVLALVLGTATLISTSAVLHLKSDGFQAHLESHAPVLVDFCVPWHEPCQNLEPEFEAAAEILKEKNITLVSIDCSEEAKLCSNYSITSHPTIRLYRGPSNFTRYREPRKASNIVFYMIKHILSPISDVDSSNIEQLLSLGAPALFAYLHADFNEPEYRANFVSFASTHRDQFIFGIAPPNLIASSPKNQFVEFALLHPSEPHLYPFIVLYNPKDEILHVFEEPFENQRIEAFVSKWNKPLVGKFDVRTYYDYVEEGLPLLHIFAVTAQDRTRLANLLAPIIIKYRGKLQLATIDAIEYGFFAANALGLIPDRFPALVIEDLVTGDTAPFDQNEEITRKGVERFVEGYFRKREEVDVPKEIHVTTTRDEL